MEQGKSGGGGGEVRVLVTGGAGYIGSWLVKKLLERGYTVHATLRDINDEGKTEFLRRLVPAAAAERLVLFEADLYDAGTFAPAIAGCRFVFLVATPLQHDATSPKYKSTAEAAADAARLILRQCEDSKTVERVIHTASMTASSPLKEDIITGYKDFIDESCWTTVDVDHLHRIAQFDEQQCGYILSKVMSEKELLSYNDGESPTFEVVTLPCPVVAGDALQSRFLVSMEGPLSPVSGDARKLRVMRQLQALIGSVPLAHVDDVCDALVFCMERPSMAGRFLCCAAYPTVADIVDHYASKYPHLGIPQEAEAVARVQPAGDKLGELGFRYKYGMEEVLDCSVECAVRLGFLEASKLTGQE